MYEKKQTTKSKKGKNLRKELNSRNIRARKLDRGLIQFEATHLSVNERNANSVVTDQCAKPLPDVAEFDKEGLHYLVTGYQSFFPCPIDDVGSPNERHPIFRHGRFFVHHLENLFLRLHH